MNSLLPQGVAPKSWMVHAAGAAVAVGIAALFYEGLYAPMQQEAAERAESSEQIRKLSTAGDKIAADHRQLTERLAALKQAAARTQRRMPTKVAPSSFVEQAARLAGDFDLEIRQSQTGVPQHHATHSTVEVSYVLSGSYASICRYLAAIDHLTQLTRVARLDAARSADSAAYPLQVTFQLYYQSDSHDKDEQRGAL